jgi:hypothetical protein
MRAQIGNELFRTAVIGLGGDVQLPAAEGGRRALRNPAA